MKIIGNRFKIKVDKCSDRWLSIGIVNSAHVDDLDPCDDASCEKHTISAASHAFLYKAQTSPSGAEFHFTTGDVILVEIDFPENQVTIKNLTHNLMTTVMSGNLRNTEWRPLVLMGEDVEHIVSIAEI